MACELLHSLVVFLVGSSAAVSARHGGNKHGAQLTRILGKVGGWVGGTPTGGRGRAHAEGNPSLYHPTSLFPLFPDCPGGLRLLLWCVGPPPLHAHAHAHARTYQVYPGILRLATDVEKVARQLFEPLALQLVRLYSTDLAAIDDSSVVTAGRRCRPARTALLSPRSLPSRPPGVVLD
jgi:hypothetical protein